LATNLRIQTLFRSYRTKLVSAYLLLIAMLLLLLGSAGYVQFKDYYLRNLETWLTKEAYLVADMTKYRNGGTQSSRSYQDICSTAALDSAVRITIIAANGLVLGDSSVASENLESHGDRPEVYAALHGEVGVEMRFSDTLGIEMLYVAVPFDDGQNRGAVRLAMPLTELNAIYHQALAFILLVALLCGLLAIGLSFALAQYFSRPLRDITSAVMDMAGGNLTRRTGVRSNDEMGILAHAFNEMGQHIETSMQAETAAKNRLEAILINTVNGIVLIDAEGRIAYANPAALSLLGLSDPVTGRKYVEMINPYEILTMIDEAKHNMVPVKRSLVLHTLGSKIIEANVVPIPAQNADSPDILVVMNDISELKRLEQVRKDFVANVSHELKTPVAAISGFAETLRDQGAGDPASVAEFSGIIYDEAQRLAMMINRLLELSKLESEQYPLKITEINLNQLLGDTVNRMSKSAALRNIELSYRQPAQEVNLVSDSNQIDQILMNLLDNAIKYSPDGGKIEIELAQEDKKALIIVEDHGTGIPEQDLSRIFERFYRVDKDRSRKTGGTGLGLAIVKHLAESLGGEIKVTSQLGSGSTFTVILPKEASRKT